jgi:hypothetical protein
VEHPAPQQLFVGTWKLAAMRAKVAGRGVEEPYGPEPLGYITYTDDGYMHAILMDPNRPEVGTPIEEFGKRTGVRRLAFFLGGIPAVARYTAATMKSAAYTATWDVHGPEVVHHVTASVMPDWIGTDMVRTYQFHADQLTLTAHYPDDQYVALVWQKAAGRGPQEQISHPARTTSGSPSSP